jgi:hypothetical protein
MPGARELCSYLDGYLGGCLSSSSILALNTSPSFSSSVSPRLLPGPLEVACCALVVAPAGLAGCVAVAAVPPPPELGSCVGVLAPPPLLPGRVRAAVLARLLLLLAGGSSLALQLRDVWPELLLASDFVLVFAFLPADEELGLSSSSSRDRVLVEGRIGLVVWSRHLFSVGLLCCGCCWMGWFWNSIGSKKNACAGRGLAAVTASVTAANTTAALPVGRKRMRASIVSVSDFTFAHSAGRCAIHVT